MEVPFWYRPRESGIVLSDFRRCTPGDAVSQHPKDGCWFTIAYETKDGIRGYMLARSTRTRAGDVRLNLASAGWKAMYLGVFLGGASREELLIRLKLSGERSFDLIGPSALGYRRLPSGNMAGPSPIPGSRNGIEEFFWKAADVEGQELIISPVRSSLPTVCHLAFVRLVAMTDQECAEYQRAFGSSETRVLAAEMDGQGPFLRGVRTEAELQEVFEPLRDTDVKKLFLGTGGLGAGQMLYPTKVGDVFGQGLTDFPDDQGKRFTESLHGFLRRGIDPLRVAVDSVHSLGVDIYLGFRMGTMAMIGPSWIGPDSSVPFWKRHAEWRCRDREGSTIPRLSMAYPEVRRFYVQLFEELAAYGVEGMQLIYIRRPPFVLFEPPVVDSFRREYGIDPRELQDDPQRRIGFYTGDERLERHWGGYVTTFMRELSGALDRYRRPDGGRMQILANVMHDEPYNRAGGMDVAAWVREGLVDILCPFTGGDGSLRVDYPWFNSILRGSACQLYEDLTPRIMPGAQYAREAQRAYASGAHGLAFWDSEGRMMMKSQWNTIRRLGHTQDLENMACQPEDYLVHPLRLLEDWNPDARYL